MILDKWITKIIIGFLCLVTLALFISRKYILNKFSYNLKKTNRKFEISLACIILGQNIVEFGIFDVLYGQFHAMIFTDICSFVYLLSIFSLFFPKWQKFRKILFPWFFIGSIVTLGFGKTWFFEQTPVTIVNILASSFFLTRHILLYVIGIYYFFVMDKYTKKELLFVGIIPVSLTVWTLSTSGLIYFITKDHRWAIYSTALFRPSISICDVDPNNVPSGYSNKMFFPNGNAYWIDPNGLIHEPWIKNTSLWGEIHYEKRSTYIILQIIANQIHSYYLWVSFLFYLVCITGALIFMFLKNVYEYILHSQDKRHFFKLNKVKS